MPHEGVFATMTTHNGKHPRGATYIRIVTCARARAGLPEFGGFGTLPYHHRFFTFQAGGRQEDHPQHAERLPHWFRTLGFNQEANLDEGAMWPSAFAMKELTAAEGARIGALVKKAVS